MPAEMKSGPLSTLRAGVTLGVFAAIGAAIVAATFLATRDRIADSEQRFILRSLNQILSEREYDNDLVLDRIEIDGIELLGADSVTVYRARSEGNPVAVIMTPVAPDGYGGPIRLLVGIRSNGTLTGVRAISHRETPGLGDAIDIDRSDWLLGFDDRSLANTEEAAWAVRRDGGDFDQFTGATVTPRAVVAAVHRALLYFDNNATKLFEAPAADVD